MALVNVLLWMVGGTAWAGVSPPVFVQRSDGESSGCNRVVAERYGNGEILAAMQRKAYTSGHVCAFSLARLAPDGAVLWERAQGEQGASRSDTIFRINDEVAQVLALPDGGALVHVQEKDGKKSAMAMTRIDARGDVVYRVVPTQSPDSFSSFRSVRMGDAVVVAGMFGRGNYQLPGGQAWSQANAMTAFMGAFDLASGELLWSRLVDQTGEVAASHRGLVSAFTEQDTQLVIRRLDATGAVTDERRYPVAERTTVTDVQTEEDGRVLVITETCVLGPDASGPQRCHNVSHLRVVSPESAEVRALQVPAVARLAPRAPGAPVRVVAPAEVRPLDIGRSWRPLHGAGLQVLTFPSSTGEPRREQLELPGTWVEVNLRGLHAMSAPDGVLISFMSAVDDPSAGASGRASATTLLFHPDPQGP